MSKGHKTGGRKRGPVAPRFWAKVEKQNAKECWQWKGAKNKKGYGLFWIGPTMKDFYPAHRFAYTLLVGPISEGLTIDHLCRNTSCVNPAHLEPVTNRENILRGFGITANRARQTHCKNGHRFSKSNTYWRKDSYGRKCRICIREQRIKHAARIPN